VLSISHPLATASLLLVLSGCSSSSSGGGSDPCPAECQREAPAHCPNDDPGTCVANCRAKLASIPAGCKSKLDSLLTCATTSPYACDATGTANPTSCQSQLDALNACVNDPGTPGPGTGTCPVVASDNACDQCVKQQCCPQVTACQADSACVAANNCAGACTTQTCVDDCTQQSPKLGSLFTCVGNSCTAPCN
jgi:hypothetical protein